MLGLKLNHVSKRGPRMFAQKEHPNQTITVTSHDGLGNSWPGPSFNILYMVTRPLSGKSTGDRWTFSQKPVIWKAFLCHDVINMTCYVCIVPMTFLYFCFTLDFWYALSNLGKINILTIVKQPKSKVYLKSIFRTQKWLSRHNKT